ncbi:MAG: desulfoferrodoxin [Bacilli bacterium]|nr:desulfoferrodoxin [Bacilli bacterium]
MQFFKCKHCGKIIAIVKGCPCPTICCGEPMEELVANTQEASFEKHIPVVTVKDNIVHVEVGSTLHPMLEAHFIEWIALQTKNGNQRKVLKPGDAPVADFALLPGDEVVACYAYCNLHGLWKA